MQQDRIQGEAGEQGLRRVNRIFHGIQTASQNTVLRAPLPPRNSVNYQRDTDVPSSESLGSAHFLDLVRERQPDIP
jgi:hypothetical protein